MCVFRLDILVNILARKYLEVLIKCQMVLMLRFVHLRYTEWIDSLTYHFFRVSIKVHVR